MTTTTPDDATDTTPVDDPPPKLRWWVEILIAVIFYAVYSVVRTKYGAGPESREIAFRHARGVIKVEKLFGLWFEPRLQHWYLSLPGRGLVRWWNIYYGTFHFFVTIGVLVLAFVKAPRAYRYLRTALCTCTGLALVGFSAYTLMPPRLLDTDDKFGGCRGQGAGCHGYKLIDTVDRYGGIWKFGQGKAAIVSNQYAAMPSLHFGWSTWCAIAFVVIIGQGRARWLAFLYPATTLLCILITANHYWLDAVGGAFVLACGFGVATLVDRKLHRRTDLRHAAESLHHPDATTA
jgi:hypothetical protein